jgi:hypothetical protein
MSAPTAYPLTWPSFRKRTPPRDRQRGTFTHDKKAIKIPEAAERLEQEVQRLGGGYLVISTNIRPTITGRPSANQGEPADPGVAVYFRLGNDPIVLACDTYDTVAQNLAGLAQHIEATRRIERYGVQSAKETLQAFSALPPPPGKRDWREVLGLQQHRAVGRDTVEEAWRYLAKAHHPDKGGDPAKMAEINAARDEALKEIGA